MAIPVRPLLSGGNDYDFAHSLRHGNRAPNLMADDVHENRSLLAKSNFHYARRQTYQRQFERCKLYLNIPHHNMSECQEARRAGQRSMVSKTASGKSQLLQAATTYASSGLGTPISPAVPEIRRRVTAEQIKM